MLSDTEWYMYCDWHNFLTEALPVKLDGIVYLRTNPKVPSKFTVVVLSWNSIVMLGGSTHSYLLLKYGLLQSLFLIANA